MENVLLAVLFFMQLSKSVKKFHTNSLASWFHITIEPDANHEYSWLVRSVSPLFVF
jgi:hypothetical protein